MATTLKHKVTLRRKVAEEEPVAAPAGNNGNGTKKWWLIIILVVVALAVALLLIFRDTDSSTENTPVKVTDNTELPVSAQSEEPVAEKTIPGPDAPVAEEIEMEEIPTEQVPQPETSVAEQKENTVCKTTISTPAASSDSLEEQARRVIRGDYGNGAERRERLGDRYREIQNRVNEIYRESNVL